MAETSKIEWTDATWNPVTGCTLVSSGCKNCYAARLAATRLKNHPSRKGLARLNAAGEAKFTGEVRFNERWLDQPLRWRRPRRIFVCAHGDLFAENVPDEWIDRVFAVMALCPQHTFQVLTKRPERMRDWFLEKWQPAPAQKFGRFDLPAEKYGDTRLDQVHYEAETILLGKWGDQDRFWTETEGMAFRQQPWPLPNVWLGTSVEDQATAEARIPSLLDTPAAIRFVSAEPLLGPVDLTRLDIDGYSEMDALNPLSWRELWDRHWSPEATGVPLDEAKEGYIDEGGVWPPTDARGARLDWVIAGGESGSGARPIHPDWPRALRDQCQAAGVAFFFKQWGEWAPPRAIEETWGFERATVLPDGQVREWAPGYPAERLVSDRMHPMFRVGKARAGRGLDGRTWDEFPRREWNQMPGGER